MAHDDFEFEPIRGLPQALPAGETILWQGAPDWWALTRDSMKVKWVAVYFVLLWGWRTVMAAADMPWGQAAVASSFFLVLGAVACLLLAAIGWCQARAAVYTITNRRVILRIGAALTMTLQFPFSWIGAADLVSRGDGTGSVSLRTLGGTRFSYLLLWPHVRPWRVAHTQPTLRCIPDAAVVARLLAEAVADADTMPRVSVTRRTPDTYAGPVPVAAE